MIAQLQEWFARCIGRFDVDQSRRLRHHFFTPKIQTIIPDPVALPDTFSLVRYGTAYGGWTLVHELAPTPHECAFSGGAGEDLSFDVAFAQAYRCGVHIIDPTPRAISHFKGLKGAVQKGSPFPINNDPDTPYDCPAETIKHLTFHEKALWTHADQLKFYVPQRADAVSHSAINLQGTFSYIEVEATSIDAIISAQEMQTVALLKLDIEGAEIEVLDHMLTRTSLRPRQLLIEFDEMNIPSARSAPRLAACFSQLKEHGYQLVYSEGRSNFLFVSQQCLASSVPAEDGSRSTV